MFDEDSYDYLKCFKHGNDRETCEHCKFIYEHDYSDHDGHEAWDYINKNTENTGSRSDTTIAGMDKDEYLFFRKKVEDFIKEWDQNKRSVNDTSVCDCGAEKVGTTHADWCSTHKMK